MLATANPDKAREVCEILAETACIPLVARPVTAAGETIAFVVGAAERVGDAIAALPALGTPPGVEETGATLEDNARIKASTLCDALGVACMADDTGLEVDALDGAPGVRSGRYAGESATYVENVRALLKALEGVAPEGRTARFVTVAVARFPGGREVVARGEVEGEITEAPRGRGRFGYDPVFRPAEAGGRTFAEMTPEEKHALSHRGRAFRALATALRERGSEGA